MKEVLLSQKVIQPIVILIIVFILCYISKQIIHKLFSVNVKIPEKKRKTVANLVTNMIIIFFSVIGLTLILQVFGIDTASFVASLGVFSLVIGLALQDLLKDIFSGIMIILEGQYSIGDWVEVGGFKGEVVASSLRTTRLKAYTGETKIIANRQINELINYSLEKNIAIVDVNVSYDTDINKVKDILTNLASRLKEENKITNMDCLGVQMMDSSAIVFRIITHLEHASKFSTQRLLNEEIIKEFKKNNIEIPYQQVVIHNGKRI